MFSKIVKTVTLALVVFICLVAMVGVCLGLIDILGVQR